MATQVKRAAKARQAGPRARRISSEAVIGRILEMIKVVPAAAEGLPENCTSRAFWVELFGRNDKTRRAMEVLQELPAFVELAPEKSGQWVGMLKKDYAGPAHARPKQEHMVLQHLWKAAQEAPTEPKKVRYWRDRFGKDQVIQRIRPKESDAYLANPHRGTTTFQRFQGDDPYAMWFTSDTHGPINFEPTKPARENYKYLPHTTLSYCRWPWSWLEPKKGQYNWKLVEQSLKTAHNRGQTLQARFQPYTQRVDYKVAPPTSKRHPADSSVNVPDWYWDTGAKWVEQGTYAPHEPDSNDPKYLKHFGDFIRAFAARFDGHPDLESIDMAYAGFWGESGGNSTPETAQKLTDIYLKSFKKTQLLSMLGTPGCKHAADRTNGTALHVGWRADCFGDLRTFPHPGIPIDQLWTHTYDLYPKEIEQCGVKEAWREAPVTMETCGNVTTWFLNDYDLDIIVREGYRYHMSVFMPKSSFFPEATLEKLIAFDKKIGYRYALRQLLLPLEGQAGKAIKIECFVDNVGCAPIYRPYPLALRFRQGTAAKVVRLKEDIRRWMPGHSWFEEQLVLPKGLKRGEVKVDLAIVDEKDKPKVWFAIDARTEDGWHPLTSMDVV